MFSKLLLLTLPLAFAGGTDPATEQVTWAQWRGPDGTGISPETAWLSEGKEENLWSANVGLGYSSMVIGDGRLFTMGYDKDAGLDVIYCLDSMSGEEIWTVTYAAKLWDQAHEGGTVNTPTLDGERLYTLNREGNLYCFKASNGEEIWHQALKEENDLKYPVWGFSGSPLVVGKNLIVNVGKLMSIDKLSGETQWISPDYGDAYCTPLAVDYAGKHMVAVFNGTHVALVEQETGKELYSYALPPANRSVNAAAPIRIDDSLFVSSNRIGGAQLLAFGEDELIEVWSSKKMKSGWAASILIDEHIYGFDNGSLKCLDLEGQQVWKERGNRVGSMSAAGKRLIVLNDKGELLIVEASPEGFVDLSKTQIFEEADGETWSLPVIAGGLIYCRASHGKLVCRDHRASE